mmetsp:Transcript_72160/g.223831  ORF Transcript_72160/g.223831 Transcript_72160/m.223831 type:complete len:300 (+) Transcript_72160:825-1724(+)
MCLAQLRADLPGVPPSRFCSELLGGPRLALGLRLVPPGRQKRLQLGAQLQLTLLGATHSQLDGLQLVLLRHRCRSAVRHGVRREGTPRAQGAALHRVQLALPARELALEAGARHLELRGLVGGGVRGRDLRVALALRLRELGPQAGQAVLGLRPDPERPHLRYLLHERLHLRLRVRGGDAPRALRLLHGGGLAPRRGLRSDAAPGRAHGAELRVPRGRLGRREARAPALEGLAERGCPGLLGGDLALEAAAGAAAALELQREVPRLAAELVGARLLLAAPGDERMDLPLLLRRLGLELR